MNKISALLLALLLALPSALRGQQVQELQRSQSPFVFPEFKEAKILQPFGRFVKAQANIFYNGATLVYKDEEGKIRKAFLKNILGVEFDSLKYAKVDSMRARVVMEKGYNRLVCVTQIDMARYERETRGGDNLPFFEIDLVGSHFFADLDNAEKREEDQYFPLQDKYYFICRGEVVPAVEREIKKRVRPDMKEAFKRLMHDPFWSWKDERSLKMLLEFLSE